MSIIKRLNYCSLQNESIVLHVRDINLRQRRHKASVPPFNQECGGNFILTYEYSNYASCSATYNYLLATEGSCKNVEY